MVNLKKKIRKVEWYKRAAEHGHDTAQFALAVMYDIGSGTEENLELANHWYEKQLIKDMLLHKVV